MYNNIIFTSNSSFYYCSGMKSVKPLSFIILLLTVFIMLRLLGSTADEYFCLSLETLVVKFNISPNLAGVTFLSFGNGAADVFSLIASFVRGAPELGLSGNVGACLFTTAIVISLILWVTAVKVHRVMYLRNILFFILSVTYLFTIYLIGKVNIFESIGLVALYVVFVIVSVIWREKEEAPEEIIDAAGRSSDLDAPLLPAAPDSLPISVKKVNKYEDKDNEFNEIYGNKEEGNEKYHRSNSDDNLAGKTDETPKKFSIMRKVRSISVQQHKEKIIKPKAELRPLPSQRAKWRHLFTVQAATYRIRAQSRAISFYI